jgi:serine/threonine-protein kinase
MYMSPEQAMGVAKIDGRPDVFAFGSILFEGLCGYRCFEAANFNALIVMIATQRPRSIDACAPYMPEPLRALVRDCLVVDRRQRIGTFDEIALRLGELLPWLENDPKRLPSPRLLGPPSDPDATNALPAMVRPSARPAAPGMLSASGIKATAARGPSGSYTWGTLPGAATRSFPLLPLAVGAAAFAIFVTVAVAFAIGFRWRAPTPHTFAATEATPAAPTAAQDGTGRLFVTATPGSCTLFIDGATKGLTPVVMDLAAGAHQLRCDPPGGKPRLASVDVLAGGAARYKFSLE